MKKLRKRMLKLKNILFLSGFQILMALQSHAGVYSQGIYSAGTTDYGLCSISLPFQPKNYSLSETSWYEYTNGFHVMYIPDMGAPGTLHRRLLEADFGTNRFVVPMDSFIPNEHWRRQSGIVTIGSGDLAQLITLCATNQGGHISINSLPVVQADWIHASQANQDIIVLNGDHFTEIQKMLEIAFSRPGSTLVEIGNPNSHSLTYMPDQIGVLLVLTITFDKQTIISIIGK